MDESLAALIGAAILAVVGLSLTHGVSELPVARRSFFTEHVIKLVPFTLFLEALSRFLYRLDRLFGFDTVPPVVNVVASHTVANFWQRYNTRVHSWFQQNVFHQLSYRRHPARAVAAVFAINGLLHELAFGIATSRFDGYQLSFFMLQIPAVLVSRRMNRFATRFGTMGAMANRCLTLTWMIATSTLFFHGVNRIFPWYTNEPWLP